MNRHVFGSIRSVSAAVGALGVVMGLGIAPAGAAPVITESFDYEAGNIHGRDGGTGWSGAWQINDPDGTAVVLEEGLTLGTMPVSGGALQVKLNEGVASFQDVVAQRAAGVTVPTGEDLWISFLYRQPGAPLASVASRSAELRHGTKLRVRPKNSGSQGIALDYGAGATANGTVNFQDGETYLIIARFGDVGQETGKAALVWVLDAADYEAVAAAGVTQAELDANKALAISNAHANHTLAAGDPVQLLVADSSNTGFGAVFDELRYGLSAADVVPVPEPASAALMSLAMLLSRRSARR